MKPQDLQLPVALEILRQLDRGPCQGIRELNVTASYRWKWRCVVVLERAGLIEVERPGAGGKLIMRRVASG